MKSRIVLLASLLGLLMWGPVSAGESPEQADTGGRLEVVPFKNDAGLRAWKVRIPGGKPLATPAYADGRLYLGGGFGSHEFYALDAADGQLRWVYHTGDDGPTAAVCSNGYIAFNTESCELEVLTPRGRRVWKRWLGDPLMSMPAIAQDRVYMAYPDSKGDRRHHVACFEAASGKPLWSSVIDGEIITAPVLDGGKLYCTTLAGLLYCFDASSGKELWLEKKNATSSPAVINGRCYYSQRSETASAAGGRQQNEQIVNRSTGKVADERVMSHTTGSADYLDYQKKASTATERAKQSQDASVGFAGSKGDAHMAQANANLGEGSVYGVWSYQGSRPFAWNGRLYSAMGDTLKSVDAASGKVVWQQTLRKSGDGARHDRTLTPPVLVNGKVFIATSYGVLNCLDASTGKLKWSVNIGEAVAFQPVVAAGRVYVPGSLGTLYCIETGDPKDDGWYMWGANAAHDGKVGR